MEHLIPIPWCIDLKQTSEAQYLIISKYCLSNDSSFFHYTLNKIGTHYQFAGIDSRGDNNVFSTIIHFGENTKLYTAQEAIDLIQGKQEIKFEIDKWYKFPNINYFAKFKNRIENQFWHTDYITDKGEFRSDENGYLRITEETRECSLEEIQESLPDNHVNKKWIPKVGDWVVIVRHQSGDPEGTVTQITSLGNNNNMCRLIKYNASLNYIRKAEPHEIPKESKELTFNDLIVGEYYYCEASGGGFQGILKYKFYHIALNTQILIKNSFANHNIKFYRLATQLERDHLDQCIAAGKYVDYKEPLDQEEVCKFCEKHLYNGSVNTGQHNLCEGRKCKEATEMYLEQKESELDIWLRETKAKNLSLEKLEYLIRWNMNYNIFLQLKGSNQHPIEKAQILYDLWNPKLHPIDKLPLNSYEITTMLMPMIYDENVVIKGLRSHKVVLEERKILENNHLQILEEKQFKLD